MIFAYKISKPLTHLRSLEHSQVRAAQREVFGDEKGQNRIPVEADRFGAQKRIFHTLGLVLIRQGNFPLADVHQVRAGRVLKHDPVQPARHRRVENPVVGPSGQLREILGLPLQTPHRERRKEILVVVIREDERCKEPDAKESPETLGYGGEALTQEWAVGNEKCSGDF
jgi:hypothetical protein